MVQRRNSRDSSGESKNSTQGRSSLNFCHESGQSYRPFTNPKRIETNDARKQSGQDPRVHVKGVPKEYLGLMDTTETSPIVSEPVMRIIEQQCSESEAILEMPNSLEDDQQMLNYNFDLAFPTTSGNPDLQIVTNNSLMPIMEAADHSCTYPALRLHIPESSSEYPNPSHGPFEEMNSPYNRITESSSVSFAQTYDTNTFMEDMGIHSGPFANTEEFLPKHHDGNLYNYDSASTYSPDSCFSSGSPQALTPDSAYPEQPQDVTMHVSYEPFIQETHYPNQAHFESVYPFDSNTLIYNTLEMHLPDQTNSFCYDQCMNPEDSGIHFSLDSDLSSPRDPCFTSRADPNAPFYTGPTTQCLSI